MNKRMDFLVPGGVHTGKTRRKKETKATNYGGGWKRRKGIKRRRKGGGKGKNLKEIQEKGEIKLLR